MTKCSEAWNIILGELRRNDMNTLLKKIIPGIAIVMFIGGLVALIPQTASAAISAACSSCHVMHASQTGTASTPRDYLLNNTCLGCHTGTNTDGTSHAPYVYTAGKTDLSAALAGGNFKFADDNDRFGHNPSELSGGADATLTGNPPGWKATGFAANGQVGGGSPDWSSNSLSCSGTYGCHGTHDSTGVTGAHHNNGTGSRTSVATVGNSYRFLYGIKGFEDDDYEFETATDHNVYLGEARSGAESSSWY